MFTKTICIDIDGTLADYSQGWQGEDKIGEPLHGAKEFLEKLRDNNWYVILFSTRSAEPVKKWAESHKLYFDAINENPNAAAISGNPGKPIALAYLDDRGLKFNGDFEEAFEALSNFRVWYAE